MALRLLAEDLTSWLTDGCHGELQGTFNAGGLTLRVTTPHWSGQDAIPLILGQEFCEGHRNDESHHLKRLIDTGQIELELATRAAQAGYVPAQELTLERSLLLLPWLDSLRQSLPLLHQAAAPMLKDAAQRLGSAVGGERRVEFDSLWLTLSLRRGDTFDPKLRRDLQEARARLLAAWDPSHVANLSASDEEETRTLFELLLAGLRTIENSSSGALAIVLTEIAKTVGPDRIAITEARSRDAVIAACLQCP